MSIVHPKTGITLKKKDYRNLSHTKRFGSLSMAQFPAEYDVGTPIFIKDQEYTDLCGAEGLAAVSEDQEGVELSPEWLFKEIKRLMGDWHGYGSDPDMVLKAALIGALEAKDSPFTWKKDGRDFIANWNNWPKELDALAPKHRKSAYFSVDGPYTPFNNARSALLTLNQPNEPKKRSILVGSHWYAEWNRVGKDGIVSDSYGSYITDHIYKFRGWKMKNGKPHLTAQLSQGTSFGDNGLLYFSEETVNREFGRPLPFMKTFSDDDPAEMKALQWGITQKIYDLMLRLLSELSTELQALNKK